MSGNMYFMATLKEGNVRELIRIKFKVPIVIGMTSTKEQVFDYCLDAGYSVLFIDEVTEQFYEKYHRYTERVDLSEERLIMR